MKGVKLGFAFTGSYCTFASVIEELKNLVAMGAEVIPIMSENAYSTDTRFGAAADFVQQIEDITGKKVIAKINEAEPIGPKKLLDALLIMPCTGNTLGKMANGVTDTAVTMAAKSHIRNGRPVIIAVSTNDGLGASAKNIGKLMSSKHIFFVPMRQDDFSGKPCSLVADFSKAADAVKAALLNEQIQPVLL